MSAWAFVMVIAFSLDEDQGRDGNHARGGGWKDRRVVYFYFYLYAYLYCYSYTKSYSVPVRVYLL